MFFSLAGIGVLSRAALVLLMLKTAKTSTLEGSTKRRICRLLSAYEFMCAVCAFVPPEMLSVLSWSVTVRFAIAAGALSPCAPAGGGARRRMGSLIAMSQWC